MRTASLVIETTKKIIAGPAQPPDLNSGLDMPFCHSCQYYWGSRPRGRWHLAAQPPAPGSGSSSNTSNSWTIYRGPDAAGWQQQQQQQQQQPSYVWYCHSWPCDSIHTPEPIYQ